MLAAAKLEQERSELESVLASGIFDRAPSLAQLLTYVCSRYFEGETEVIKEYNIAVEALGRAPEFDPKRDSIVRVEAHRLRKRLHEYYAKEGSGHAVQIVIPSGHYTPKFVIPGALLPAVAGEEAAVARQAAEATPAAPAPAPLEFALVRPWYRRPAWIAVPLAGLAALATIMFLAAVNIAKKPRPPAADISAMVATTGDVRILAGTETGAYVDGFSRAWQSDRYFSGGSVFQTHDHPILGTRDPGIYQNRREGFFSYDIPLKPGIYELRLHFAETLYGENNTAGGGESSRLFNVQVNGKEMLHEFDVTGEVGPSVADTKIFKDISPAADGKLHLRFEGVTGVPFLNAIEIAPGVPGALRPIRIVARDRGLTDRDGRYWEPDRYSRGGQLVVRSDPVSRTSNPELYRGERFGNLSYAIPVAPGRYRVNLYFAETWFGPNKPGHGGAGSRLFDILCNGVALVRNFDIYKEAGGSDRGLVRSFQNLQPNAQGKLVISLAPVRNYACLNALEVLDETR
jgi:hypothetical protein